MVSSQLFHCMIWPPSHFSVCVLASNSEGKRWHSHSGIIKAEFARDYLQICRQCLGKSKGVSGAPPTSSLLGEKGEGRKWPWKPKRERENGEDIYKRSHDIQGRKLPSEILEEKGRWVSKFTFPPSDLLISSSQVPHWAKAIGGWMAKELINMIRTDQPLGSETDKGCWIDLGWFYCNNFFPWRNTMYLIFTI